MRSKNPLSRLRFGPLIFLLCGLQALPALALTFQSDDDLIQIVALTATILSSAWIGLGGRINPWRLLFLVLLGLPTVWLVAQTSSNRFRWLLLIVFFLMLSTSSVLLAIRFFGWQMRRVRHPRRIRDRGKSIRRRRAACESPVAVKPAMQFTLRGMLTWTLAWAVVLGSLTTLWPMFCDAVRPTSNDFFWFGWFPCFAPVALWLACGFHFLPLRIAAFLIVAYVGGMQADWHQDFLLFGFWVGGVFLLIRLAGYRFLRVSNRPISIEPSPRPCASARES